MRFTKMAFALVFLSAVSMGAKDTMSGVHESPTADQQGMNASDTDITAQIRRELMKTDGLSLDAQNVKIITQNGNVTLRGTVKTLGEKSAVENAAFKVVKRSNVRSQLEVNN